MASRQAACEPCRKAKVACDHVRPECTRCQQNAGVLVCHYRESPFKRRRLYRDSPKSQSLLTSNESSPTTAPVSNGRKRNNYPNSGHFGSSSHVAIFNEIPPSPHHDPSPRKRLEPSSSRLSVVNIESDGTFRQALDSLKGIFNEFDMSSMSDLVRFWHAKGTNLALASPFSSDVLRSMSFVEAFVKRNSLPELGRRMLENSELPLQVDHSCTESMFISQFCDHKTRWETVALFFVTVIRATFDNAFYPLLYESESRRQRLRECLKSFVASVMQICISLDNLNDLQVVLQYEIFIVRSYIDGDHSLSSWRSLGDVISSAFALGYHEDIDGKQELPPFLAELRKTAFARLYSADKNVAIFLGRPPRMTRRFSCFQIPSCSGFIKTVPRQSEKDYQGHHWHPDTEISYRSETCWSAICAYAKEGILEIMFHKGRNESNQSIRFIADWIEAQWIALPSHFHLSCCLRDCPGTPFERDFLLSSRLNFLHVKFLLHLAALERLNDPSAAILEASQEILTLVVEAILYRENLVNSGTGLVWKILHYGLPAAGIIILGALSGRKFPDQTPISVIHIRQRLSTLVAEIQMGTVVRTEEPSFMLLDKAADVIQDFLESSLWHDEGPSRLDLTSTPDIGLGFESWPGQLGVEPWNLEIGFWESLAEHPLILNNGLSLSTTA